MKSKSLLIFGLSLTLLLVGVFAKTWAQEMQEKMVQPPVKAVAVLYPTEGNKVAGIVHFTQMEHGVQVEAKVTGLEAGNHGFHVHEFGDCGSPDGKSAGGHFNPFDKPHAGPEDQNRHVGDLGNILSGENGLSFYQRIDTHLTLSGPASIIGRGIIIHAGQDDFKTQPTGAAGARVACGVIGVDSP